MGGKIVTGAHVIVYVNGERFGSIFSFRYSGMSPSKEIGGIDLAELVELAPTTSKTSGTMGIYRLIASGGAEGAGLVPVSMQMPRGKYFSMQLIERTTDTTIFASQFCRVEHQDWEFEAKNMAKGMVSWKALRHSNEVTPSGL